VIGDRIRLARNKAGLSLRDLAAEMNELVTAQAIGKYERGEDIPSSKVLNGLAKALDVSLSYLLDTQGIVLSGVEFRTKANTTAKDRAHVETDVLEWIERYLQIELVLDLDSAKWQCPVPCPAKLNDVDPHAWLADALTRIPDHPAKRIRDLLPWLLASATIRRRLNIRAGRGPSWGLHRMRT